MGTNGRQYLIFDLKSQIDEANTSAENKAAFEAAIKSVIDGTAQKSKGGNKPGYANPNCLRANGKDILDNNILEYFLFTLGARGFNYEEARDFTDKIRRLLGWNAISYTLQKWVERCLRNPYMISKKPDEYYTSDQEWVANPNEVHDLLPESMFEFACYIAICNIKYGPSYASVTANEIFGYVSALGSDLPAKLKEYGSGEMPKALSDYKDGEVTGKANDAFATIKIALKVESEENYGKALDYLCRLLETDFPRSYTISFRSPEKHFLPIKGLPKKGIHLLFANAAQYPKLYTKIEKYARFAMREYEWYNDLEDEYCAMPGTFAVFVLGLADEKYTQLILDYLDLVDDEHQSIQEKFTAAYINKYGFTCDGLKVFIACTESIQSMTINKIYAEKIANEPSLNLLLKEKPNIDPDVWLEVLYGIWGYDEPPI